MQTKIYKNLIGGRWVSARTGKTFLNLNPAKPDDVVGEFQSSGREDVTDAVREARTAFKAWRLVPRRNVPRFSIARARSCSRGRRNSLAR